MRFAVIVALGFNLSAVQNVAATPVAIDVATASFKTSLSINGYDPIADRTDSASDDVESALELATLLQWNPRISANANATLFGVSTYTIAGSQVNNYINTVAVATASTDLTFSPQGDAAAAIQIDFSGVASAFNSNGAISLFDVTAGQGLWNYFWNGPGLIGTGNVPFQREENPPSASAITFVAAVTESTLLLASHVYRLQLFTGTNANGDQAGMSIALSGLQTVPEPATAILVLTAAFPLFALISWRKRRARPRGLDTF
jgi:hypothetical protein